MSDTVTLGEHENIPCVPQRHAYLENRLGRFFEGLTKIDTDALAGDGIGTQIATLLGDQAYDALCVFLPALSKRMPRWEFAGYGSADAMAAGDYDEEQDKSPTFPQIVAAFEKAVEVNRFNVFTGVGGMLKGLWEKADPTLVGQWLNVVLAEVALKTSPSSPPVSGESDSMSSTPNGRTVAVNAV